MMRHQEAKHGNASATKPCIHDKKPTNERPVSSHLIQPLTNEMAAVLGEDKKLSVLRLTEFYPDPLMRSLNSFLHPSIF